MTLTNPVGQIRQNSQKKNDMETFPLSELKVTARDEHSVPEAFFGKVYSSFLRAVEAIGGAHEYFYEVGGYSLRLRFAGPAMVPLITRALSHLEKQPGLRADLTICLWDSVSTNTEMPPPPWSKEDYLARGEIRSYNDDRVYTNFNLGSGILNMLELKKNSRIAHLCG